MPQPNQEPKSESLEIDGHVVVIACALHADTGRWEPSASVKPSWSTAPAVELRTTPEHFQDTPIAAMAVARKIAADWLAANPPQDGTVDAAV
jgi:hypothetical protein